MRPSFLSPAAVRPLIGGPATRPDEENIARMAWASGKVRQKSPATQLEILLHYPGLGARPVHARVARQALQSGCPLAQAGALTHLWQECERLRLARLHTLRHFPALA